MLAPTFYQLRDGIVFGPDERDQTSRYRSSEELHLPRVVLCCGCLGVAVSGLRAELVIPAALRNGIRSSGYLLKLVNAICRAALKHFAVDFWRPVCLRPHVLLR